MDNDRCNKHGESLSALEAKVNIIEVSVSKIADAQVDMIGSVATIKEITTALKAVTNDLKINSSAADDRISTVFQHEKNTLSKKIDSVEVIAYKAYNGVWLICSVGSAIAIILGLFLRFWK